jgi:hypothetical protein
MRWIIVFLFIIVATPLHSQWVRVDNFSDNIIQPVDSDCLYFVDTTSFVSHVIPANATTAEYRYLKLWRSYFMKYKIDIAVFNPKSIDIEAICKLDQGQFASDDNTPKLKSYIQRWLERIQKTKEVKSPSEPTQKKP